MPTRDAYHFPQLICAATHLDRHERIGREVTLNGGDGLEADISPTDDSPSTSFHTSSRKRRMNEHLNERAKLITAGDVAPEFTLLDQHRKEWKLSDAIRKGDVVLCFFPLAFTDVCGTEMKCVDAEMNEWKNKGAEVVGISCDSFATLKAWSEASGFKQPMLADMHRKVCKAFGLYWPELNVSKRGTIIIGQSDDGVGNVKWSQSREPGQAMTWDEVLGNLG